MSPWRLPTVPLQTPDIYPSYAVTAEVLSRMGVPPDFEADGPVRYTHRRDGEVDIYFLGNTQSQPLSGSPWTLTVYSPLGQLNNLSAIRAVVGGISTVLLCILAVLIFQRRRHLKDHRAAQQALQAAHDELERKVAERTRDLSAANQRRHDEIGERVRAEQTRRDAQDELIQAGKLAVIGRLSTGIAHELNQPLAALRTLSGNAIRFLERGDLTTVRSNLERIAQLRQHPPAADWDGSFAFDTK